MTRQEFFKLYASVVKRGKRNECRPNPYLKHYKYSVFWSCEGNSRAYASSDGTYSITLSDGTNIYLFKHSDCVKAYDKEDNKIW